MFGRYGVRVPAMIVSPWVPPGMVSKTLFDHTSIIKSILLRFCAADLKRRDRRERFATWLQAGHPHYMGARVAHANNLGELLTNATPRSAPPHDGLIAEAASRAAAEDRKPGDRNEPDQPSTDLQKRIAAAGSLLRSRGHPATRP
jgi:phospholipase C